MRGLPRKERRVHREAADRGARRGEGRGGGAARRLEAHADSAERRGYGTCTVQDSGCRAGRESALQVGNAAPRRDLEIFRIRKIWKRGAEARPRDLSDPKDLAPEDPAAAR